MGRWSMGRWYIVVVALTTATITQLKHDRIVKVDVQVVRVDMKYYGCLMDAHSAVHFLSGWMRSIAVARVDVQLSGWMCSTGVVKVDV